MPEMPEVETMVDRLQRWVGYNIVTADGRHERYLPGNERVFATGQRINGIFRRGKFIIFMLERGALLCHNAMSGYWDSEDDRWTFDYVEGGRTSSDDDIRACLLLCPAGKVLSEEGRNVFFHDARKFGSLRYVEPEELTEKLSRLGPEADHTTWMYEPAELMTPVKFVATLEKSGLPVKELLMEQEKIAGVGNIYASEACFHAQINPLRPASGLSEEEQLALFLSIRSVLRQALERRLDYGGLKIYRREKCPKCGDKTATQKMKGRTTYWCPTCQK